ncbi:alanine racemase [Streptococcus sp. CSL10205-OR2]|uniref:alanine racemase n=1 Tax=Streptococcus sp. CSL10205-OR2 TaxID=2980558 RepID=UPI0021D99461|nr:alanine racemase [Streptococcus sp. CSL10205-OR2]MCU9533967.1 alanine racemase [Streptococcus sp. CSL10205-OR2]
MVSSIHRPTRAKINLQAISDNIETIKSHLPQKTQFFAVVKANAYGHGAVNVAKSIENQVDTFCVSNIDEGLELRQSGVKKPILVLGAILPDEIKVAIQYDLVVTIASIEWLEMVKKEGLSLSQLSVHIKVDSGMGRIGVRSLQQTNQLIKGLKEYGARIEGIFTHFATADETDDSQYQQQLTFFKELINQLEDKPAIIHTSNSAASLWHTDSIMTAVRIGIALYGLNPSGVDLDLPYPLKPALHLESALVNVKEINSGDLVGYGATYQAQKTEWIGTVPIGYADGWTRDMQGFSVLVDGEFCEIVGRVSMDQMTIRLPNYYPLGTKVTLIGRDGDQTITATQVAQQRKTINYEVLCLLSERIPREYE